MASAPSPPPLPTMHTPSSTAAGKAPDATAELESAKYPITPAAAASKNVDALPTPTSTSDGRTQAAQLLKDRIKAIQDEDTGSGGGGSVRGNLFPHSPTPDDVTRASDENSRIVDFSGDDGEKSCGSSFNEQQLRNEKNEAQATMALLQAELLAARGRHEEEKREWMRSMDELRRRNEELERRLSLYSLEGTKRGSNARSASVPKGSRTEVGENDGYRFGLSQVRNFAQRFSSAPAPAPDMQQPPKLHPDEISISSTIATNDIDTTGLSRSILKGDISLHDSDQQLLLQENITVLEEKLRQSEHRAKVLEQRLQIVKESGDAVIRSLNEELSDVAEDRARSESAMIKELAALDSQRRQEKEDFEKRIDAWIALDERRTVEVKEYERRIKSLLEVVQRMDANNGLSALEATIDAEAENQMYNDLIEYLQLLSQRRTLVRSVNEALDMEFNANPNVADEMIEYYKSRPELKEFTLKSELPRMDYEVLVVDDETGEDAKLTSTDDIRSYFSSLEEKVHEIDEEIEIILRAANQSLLADPLAMLTGEGEGKLVHFGSFHSTLIATVCSFQLDLRREGERRVKVNCELAVCVPSGLDGAGRAPEKSPNDNNDEARDEEDKIEQSATLELARASLSIQFSPSPTSTPCGPLVKYTLVDVKPMITDYDEGSEDAMAMHMAAAVLARDRHNNIRVSENPAVDIRPNATKRFFSRFPSMSIRNHSVDG